MISSHLFYRNIKLQVFPISKEKYILKPSFHEKQPTSLFFVYQANHIDCTLLLITVSNSILETAKTL